MSANFGQLISHLAKKAGLPEDDAQLINLLSNAELTRVQVPQEFYAAIDNKLLNVDDAKNNHPLIKAHYFAQAYNGLDSEMSRLKDDFQIDDDTWTELSNERSSTKRVVAMVKKIKELEALKHGGTKDKTILQKQIDDLTTELVEAKKQVQREKDNAVTAVKGLKIENAFTGMFSGLSTIYDELDPQVKNMTIRNIIQQALRQKDYDFILTDSELLDLQKKDGSKPYTENHQLVTAKDFIEATLANAKILKRQQQQGSSDDSQQQNGQQQQQGQPSHVDGGGQKVNRTLQGLVAQSQADLQKASTAAIF
jgi:hypothetical protein